MGPRRCSAGKIAKARQPVSSHPRVQEARGPSLFFSESNRQVGGRRFSTQRAEAEAEELSSRNRDKTRRNTDKLPLLFWSAGLSSSAVQPQWIALTMAGLVPLMLGVAEPRVIQ